MDLSSIQTAASNAVSSAVTATTDSISEGTSKLSDKAKRVKSPGKKKAKKLASAEQPGFCQHLRKVTDWMVFILMAVALGIIIYVIAREIFGTNANCEIRFPESDPVMWNGR